MNKQILDLTISILREEYLKEKQTTDTLDTKAGILLSGFVVALTVQLQIMDISQITHYIKQDSQWTSYVFVLVVLSVVMGILVLIFLLISVKTNDFYSVNYQSVIENCNHNVETEPYKKAIIEHYKVILDENTAINERKSKKLKVSMILFAIYIMLVMLFVISMKLLMS